jgi:hypothetical protein
MGLDCRRAERLSRSLGQWMRYMELWSGRLLERGSARCRLHWIGESTPYFNTAGTRYGSFTVPIVLTEGV